MRRWSISGRGGDLEATMVAMGHDRNPHILRNNYFHWKEPSCPGVPINNKLHHYPCSIRASISLQTLLDDDRAPSSYDILCPVAKCTKEIAYKDREDPIHYNKHLWNVHGIVPYGYEADMNALDMALGKCLEEGGKRASDHTFPQLLLTARARRASVA